MTRQQQLHLMAHTERIITDREYSKSSMENHFHFDVDTKSKMKTNGNRFSQQNVFLHLFEREKKNNENYLFVCSIIFCGSNSRIFNWGVRFNAIALKIRYATDIHRVRWKYLKTKQKKNQAAKTNKSMKTMWKSTFCLIHVLSHKNLGKRTCQQFSVYTHTHANATHRKF